LAQSADLRALDTIATWRSMCAVCGIESVSECSNGSPPIDWNFPRRVSSSESVTSSIGSLRAESASIDSNTIACAGW
jgi:hypothetical protein